MVQTAALISLFGSLVAVGVPTFQRTVRRSKVAEATTELERLQLAVAAYYSTRHGQDVSTKHCLPEAAGPTPAAPTVEPTEVVFAADAEPGAPTWKALAYQPLGPIRYSYSFTPASTGCDTKAHGAVATVRAAGDLDGDGAQSHFERRLLTNREREVVSGDVLFMRDRVE